MMEASLASQSLEVADLAGLRQMIAGLLAAESGAGGARLTRISWQGRDFWLKRPERPGFRMRLQKGDPRAAFERERAGLHTLGRLGLSVPQLVDEGPDHLLIADGGVPLTTLLRDATISDAEARRAILAAAEALYHLHAAGVAHGRPSLKDTLWDGQRISLIDLERFGVTRDPYRAQVMDLMLFAFSCFMLRPRGGRESAVIAADIEAALAHYHALDTGRVWEGAVRWVRGKRWLLPLSWPLRVLRPSSRELQAIPRLFQHFA